MFSKKNFKRYAIINLIINIIISVFIFYRAINFLPAYMMGVLYLCVGINDWHFRYPHNYVGPAIDGWLMLFAAILGFGWVNNAYPDLKVWCWLSTFTAIMNIPAMLHPNNKIDF